LVRVVTQTLKILSILVVSGVVLVGSVGFFNYWSDRTRAEDLGRPVTLTVSAADDGGDVADKLTDSDLVKYGVYFETRLRFSGNDLQPGTYTLRKGMSTSEIIDMVTVSTATDDTAEAQDPAAAPSTELQVTFVEGQRIEEFAATLQEAGWTGDPQAFIDAARNPANVESWDFLADLPEGASLEGFLFPDTYTIPSNAAAQDVIDYMLTNFDTRFSDEMRQQAGAQGLSIYEVVTLASIVEREAVVPEERATIAAVYLNRLDSGTQLQADPTKQYAVGTSEDWWPELNTELIEQAESSPYDTYIVEGLPPGPIANPGLRALQGILDPDDVDFLYMVAKDDGSDTHAFTNDLEEHEENICTYDPDAEICGGAESDAPENAFVHHQAHHRRLMMAG